MEYYHEAYLPTYGGILAAGTVYFGITTALYWRRGDTAYFAGRSMLWNLLQAAGSYGIFFITCISEMFWVMPCFIQLWGYNMAGVTWVAAVSCKGFKYYYDFKITQAKLFGAGSANRLSSAALQQEASLTDSIFRGLTTAEPKKSQSSETPKLERKETKDWSKALESNYYWINRHRATNRFLLRVFAGFIGFVVVGLLIISCCTEVFRIWPKPASPPGCFATWEYWLCYSIMAGYQLAACPFLWWRIRSARDNHGVRNDLLAITCITGPLWLFSLLWKHMLGYDRAYKYFPGGSWFLIAMVFSHTRSVTMPLINSYREEWRRAKMVLKYNMGSFMEVLSDRAVWEEFKVFVAADMCVENALFYEAYQELMVLTAASCVRANVIVPGLPNTGPALSQSALPRCTPIQPHQDHRQYFHHRLSNIFQSLIPQRRRQSFLPMGNTSQPATPPAASPDDRDRSPIAKVSSMSSGVSEAGNMPIIRSSIFSTVSTDMKPFFALPIPPAVMPHYKAFYETYLKPGAPYEVNVTSAVRDEAEKAIKEGKMTVGMFEDALEQVVENMFFNSFASFLSRHNARYGKAQTATLKSSFSTPTVMTSASVEEGDLQPAAQTGTLGMTEP